MTGRYIIQDYEDIPVYSHFNNNNVTRSKSQASVTILKVSVGRSRKHILLIRYNDSTKAILHVFFSIRGIFFSLSHVTVKEKLEKNGLATGKSKFCIIPNRSFSCDIITF